MIEAVKKTDAEPMNLQVIGREQFYAMATQGSCWIADSRLDEVEDNEVTAEKVQDRFLETFHRAAGDKLAKMEPAQRQEAEKVVKEDIRKIIEKVSFCAKQHPPI